MASTSGDEQNALSSARPESRKTLVGAPDEPETDFGDEADWDEDASALKESVPEARRSFWSELARYRALVPCVLGLMCARSGLIVGSYGSYVHTDEGLYTDGSMLVALVFVFFGWLAVRRSNGFAGKRRVNLITRAGIVGEAASLAALACCDFFACSPMICRFGVSVVLTLSSSLAMFGWLRRARGASNATAVVFAFGTLALSEVVVWPFTFVPAETAYCLAAVMTLAQFPCIAAARRQPDPFSISSPTNVVGYFGFSRTMLSNKRYLATTAIGIGLMSLVIGLLRGYPDGTAVSFTPPTRVAYAVLTIALCALIVHNALCGRRQTMTVFIWLLMQTLCVLALFVYALFPRHLEFGAVFTTTLNAMMVSFTWYVIIAFESCGWRDSYYYAFAGWLVWLGARSIARIILFAALPVGADTLVVQAAIGALIVVSTQAVFVQFTRLANRESRNLAMSYEELRKRYAALRERTLQTESEREPDRARSFAESESKLARIMGLDGNESFTDIRMATMEHNARELGKQFLLSDREIEVVTLYSLGFTQKRVAEELFISQGTAHAHIKRIYAKTGLHSRQELLDYMQKYTS